MFATTPIFRALLLGLTLVSGPQIASADNTLVADSLAVSSTRAANSALNGLAAEKGQVAWKATDNVVFGSAGGVTVNNAQAGMAVVPIHADSAKPVRLQADVNPQSSGFTALVLLDDDNLANFWKTAALWAYVGTGGNWGLYSQGQSHVLAKGVIAPGKFHAGDFNHLELLYNPATSKATLKINGTAVAQDIAVSTAPAQLAAAGIRINDPVTAGAPLIKNFAVDQPDATP